MNRTICKSIEFLLTDLSSIECAKRVKTSSLTDITNTNQTRYESAGTVFVWFYLLCEGVSAASDPFSMNEFIVFQQNYHWDAFISNEENKFEKDILMNSEYSFYKVLGTNERSNIGREISVGLEIHPKE